MMAHRKLREAPHRRSVDNHVTPLAPNEAIIRYLTVQATLQALQEQIVRNSIPPKSSTLLGSAEMNQRVRLPEWPSALPFAPQARRRRKGPNTRPWASNIWMSPQQMEQKSFDNWIFSMNQICRNSPFVPTTMVEWLEYRRFVKEAQILQAEKKLQMARGAGAQVSNVTIVKPFLGKVFFDREPRSAIFWEQTIWCHSGNLKQQRADWPSMEELRWEGDDRARSGVGRFPPIPRWTPDDTICWKQCEPVLTYSLDRVWLTPTMEDIIAPVDEIEEEDIPALISKDLLDALDPDE